VARPRKDRLIDGHVGAFAAHHPVRAGGEVVADDRERRVRSSREIEDVVALRADVQPELRVGNVQ
jgi:hypothetical protein